MPLECHYFRIRHSTHALAWLLLTLDLRVPRRTLTGAVVRDEHHAKARLPGHHLRVGGRRLVQRDGLVT